MRFILYRASMVCMLLALFLLSACGGDDKNGATQPNPTTNGNSTAGVLDANKKYTVDFWEAFATGANKKTLEQLTQEYMQKHSNVTVKLTAYDAYPTLNTKITAAIAAGKPPTIAQVYENWATKYQQADALASFKPFIEGKNGLSQSDIADFYPSMWKDGQVDGTQYMLPFNKSVIVMYYNADALQKAGITPPTTMDELKEDLTKVTKDGQWGLSVTPDVDLWSILYKNAGGTKFVSDDGKSAEFGNSSNTQYTKQALGDLAPLVKSGAIHVTSGYSWQNDFVSQKSLFAISTVASYSFLKNLIKDKFKFSEAAVPKGSAAQSTVLFGTNVAMFSKADADSQTAGWDFIKFLTSKEANTTFVKGTGYLPIRQSVASESVLNTPERKAGPDSINFSFVPATVPAWSQCRDIITGNFASTMRGQVTADTAATKMIQACNSTLSQD